MSKFEKGPRVIAERYINAVNFRDASFVHVYAATRLNPPCTQSHCNGRSSADIGYLLFLPLILAY